MHVQHRQNQQAPGWNKKCHFLTKPKYFKTYIFLNMIQFNTFVGNLKPGSTDPSGKFNLGSNWATSGHAADEHTAPCQGVFSGNLSPASAEQKPHSNPLIAGCSPGVVAMLLSECSQHKPKERQLPKLPCLLEN